MRRSIRERRDATLVAGLTQPILESRAHPSFRFNVRRRARAEHDVFASLGQLCPERLSDDPRPYDSNFHFESFLNVTRPVDISATALASTSRTVNSTFSSRPVRPGRFTTLQQQLRKSQIRDPESIVSEFRG